MTWFFKTFAFCVTVLLISFILEVLGSTMVTCQRRCKDEPDDNLCGRKMFEVDGGQKIAEYKWMRNECERKCVSKGGYEKVDMGNCTMRGQNYTTYKCTNWQGHPGIFHKCMRNVSNHNTPK